MPDWIECPVQRYDIVEEGASEYYPGNKPRFSSLWYDIQDDENDIDNSDESNLIAPPALPV